jgi:spore maturation protein CgeB
MKIIIVAPKTITAHRHSDVPFRYDYAFWNFYMPLLSLGHDVEFFDSSLYGDKELEGLIEKKKPNLLFCIMTGDKNYCPYEPWETIKKETEKGRLTTFNWFCDDTWRFENFTSKYCWYFHVVSTPEKYIIPKYKEIGYNNVIHGIWHSNSSVYSNVVSKKTKDISFVGQPHGDRLQIFNSLKSKGINIVHKSNLSFEDMIHLYSSSHIGLNLSKNNSTSQLKARMFEIPAVGSLLLSEDAEGLEECFEDNKEIIIFKSIEELIAKANFLIKNPSIINKISSNGHKRYLQEHDSKIRLQKVLAEIELK